MITEMGRDLQNIDDDILYAKRQGRIAVFQCP